MADDYQTGFMQSIKGKIIIASVLGCFALLLAWGVSKIAFKQMLNAVENISAPNDRLRLVNELSRGISQLDQEQKLQLLHNGAKHYGFAKTPKKLNLIIDTLKTLYVGNSIQLRRIATLKKILTDRDRLFINYLDVRNGLVNNKSFLTQVKSLNQLVNQGATQDDSTVTTTEKKTSTTIVYPSKTKKSRGFFSRLFGKNKSSGQPAKPYRVVNEELSIKHDTLAKAIKDSIINRLGEAMRGMEETQRRKSALFVTREAILINTNNKLVHQILTILKQVENETVTQITLNNKTAKNVVKTSVQHISLIMLSFFLITVVLLYLILTDIARSNRYRKALEKAKDEAEYHGQAKHRFLSNMSHEIRTPLQSIIGYAELVRQQYPDQKDIDAIYHSSSHLMQIVNEVLDYNRIISGKFTFLNEVFNMVDVLDEVVSVLRFQAEKKSVLMVGDYKIPSNDHIYGDPFRLKQVLYNLIGNAIKFTQVGQVTLAVCCEERNEYLQYTFTITDTGIGLSENDIARIFNEFEQAEGQFLKHSEGTGLGLAISKALVENQGGTIAVKSELGKGSSFTFDLSFKKAEMPAPEIQKRAHTRAKIINDKIWIIDDDTFILDMCGAILKKNNIKHRCFNSAQEMLTAEWDNAVNYILMDIRMPDMSGTELCKLLRKKIPANVMIYALTAQAMPDEGKHIISCGFNGLLIKPFKEDDLLKLFNNGQVTYANPAPDMALDISKVEKMTFGDKSQLNKILRHFIENSINDIAGLKLGIKNHDYEKIKLLMHRIAGRTAQIGASSLATGFRIKETEFYKNGQLSHEDINAILPLIEKLQQLIQQIKRDYLYNDTVNVSGYIS